VLADTITTLETCPTNLIQIENYYEHSLFMALRIGLRGTKRLNQFYRLRVASLGTFWPSSVQQYCVQQRKNTVSQTPLWLCIDVLTIILSWKHRRTFPNHHERSTLQLIRFGFGTDAEWNFLLFAKTLQKRSAFQKRIQYYFPRPWRQQNFRKVVYAEVFTSASRGLEVLCQERRRFTQFTVSGRCHLLLLSACVNCDFKIQHLDPTPMSIDWFQTANETAKHHAFYSIVLPTRNTNVNFLQTRSSKNKSHISIFWVIITICRGCSAKLFIRTDGRARHPSRLQ